MKSTLDEKIRHKLIKIGRKNQIFRVLIIPVLFLYMFLNRVILGVRNNTKRIALMGIICLFYIVYSSFSFPLFTFTNVNDGSVENDYSNINLAQISDIKMEDVELINDNEILGTEKEDSIHDFDDTDVYDAREIFEFTEFQSDSYTAKENSKFKSLVKTEISKYFSKDDWKLVLVNKQHSIPDDYSFVLGNITDSMQCDARIIDDLLAMLKAAYDDGIELVIRSPYRSLDRQKFLFNRKIALYMKKGMSFAESYQLSSEAVTVPGASEHQIGLALDITSSSYSYLEDGFADTEAGKWLAENSYKYGFIIRYPQGKEYLTGIEFEPWHFRYVGSDAATVITLNDLCLEEFYEELD